MVPTKNPRRNDRVPTGKKRGQHRRTSRYLKILLTFAVCLNGDNICLSQAPSPPGAQAAKPAEPKQEEPKVYDSPFLKDDQVVFIGDSITQAGEYVDNLYLFYATRFPDRRFTIHNAGMEGDTVPQTLARFESDIAVHKPTVAVILLGMNDAWDDCFLDRPASIDQQALQRKAIQAYTDNIQRLSGALREIECHRVLIKPSIYDETAQLEQPTKLGKNEMLRQFGVFLDLLAANENSDLVDFFDPLMQVNQHLQGRDPAATIVGPDRVHPDAQGHFVMTYAFLKAFDTPSFVSRISIDARDPRRSKQLNCDVSELSVELGSIVFQCTERSLPFPVRAEQRPALQWTGFHQEYNRQVLSVAGLKPGRYELKVDGQKIGIWPASSFAEGINLCAHPSMPQLQQARQAMAFNQQRAAITDQLRSVALVQRRLIPKLKGIDLEDRGTVKKGLDRLVAKSKGKPWHASQVRHVDTYWKILPQIDSRQKTMAEIDEQFWKAVRPKPHRWEIQRVD